MALFFFVYINPGPRKPLQRRAASSSLGSIGQRGDQQHKHTHVLQPLPAHTHLPWRQGPRGGISGAQHRTAAQRSAGQHRWHTQNTHTQHCSTCLSFSKCTETQVTTENEQHCQNNMSKSTLGQSTVQTQRATVLSDRERREILFHLLTHNPPVL